MNSYQLLEFYECVMSELNQVEFYTKELGKIVELIKKNEDSFLKSVYVEGAGGNLGAKINEVRQNVFNKLNQFIGSFDILENQQQLIRIKDNIGAVAKDYQEAMGNEFNDIKYLIDQYMEVIRDIYSYVKSKDNSMIVELINRINQLVNIYNHFITSYRKISDCIYKTESKIEVSENEKEITLQFYYKNNNLEDYISNLKSVYNCYELFCNLFNVSVTQNQLKVVKLESGSLFEKFVGAEKVVDALALLLSKTITLIFNKFTFEGQVLRRKQLLEILKDDVEILEKYKQLGFSIDFAQEDVEKTYLQIISSIQSLASKNTKVKINDEIIDIGEGLSKKYLSMSVKLLTEEKNM